MSTPRRSLKTDAGPTDHRSVSGTAEVPRRRLLAWGGIGATALALGTASTASAASSASSAAASATGATTMWRLEHDWGFPLSPSGRSACSCRACVSHGTNKLFFSRAAAENGRAHPGCCCLATPIHLGDNLDELRALSTDGESADRRRPEGRAALRRLERRR